MSMHLAALAEREIAVDGEMPIGRVLGALDSRGCAPRPRNSRTWRARCPNASQHRRADRNPSLDITEGDDGRVLMKCHGCMLNGAQLAGMIGMNVRELFPTYRPSERRAPNQTVSLRGSFASLEDADRAWATQAGGIRWWEPWTDSERGLFGPWTYADRDGRPVFGIVRADIPGKPDEDGRPTYRKGVRPLRWDQQGRRWKATGIPTADRPLYNLAGIEDAERVFVVEGEKCADMMIAIGLPATTSSFGANGPQKTDWSPLAGKEVVIIPDNDSPGEGYAGAVSTILSGLDPRPTVLTFRPDVPFGHDVFDWTADPDGTKFKDSWEPDQCREAFLAILARDTDRQAIAERKRSPAELPAWIADPAHGDTKIEAAEVLILDTLTRATGPVPAVRMYELAAGSNIGKRTLNKAKARLGVISERVGISWGWALPRAT